MIKKIMAGMCFVFMMALAQAVLAEDSSSPFTQVELKSPVGFWQTIDDKTNQPRSIVKIFSYQGKLYGRIIAAYYQPGEGPDDTCIKCTSRQKNEKILGMIFITNMWQNPDDDQQWIDGLILDPNSGKVYKSKMTLQDGGKKLEVRGYIGISLLGRSQTWNRVSQSILKNLPASSVIAKNINDDTINSEDSLDGE